ncbi:MAG: hypothetical protein HY923_04710 [Elusimicrobia bacterium]|nr:hypothetical protein [Elusimicrobiota bacterium]
MNALLAAVVLALVSPASAELPGVYLTPAPAKLRFDPRCVLHAVAGKMAADIGRYRGPEFTAAIADAAKTTPRVRLKSETTLEEFQRAVRRQAPGATVISNMYSVDTGEVFLSDEAKWYEASGRALDDSLAHEFVHHIQVKYLGYGLEDLSGDDSAEGMAVQYQTWFREEFIKGGKPLPCP